MEAGATGLASKRPLRRLRGLGRAAFFRPRRIFGRLLPRRARLVVAGMMFAMTAILILMPRATGRLLRLEPGRLNAPQGPPQLVNLAFVGHLLALGQFDQFQNFVQLIEGLPERLRDFRGMRHGLVDGRGLGRAKISGLHPWFGFRPARFGAAERTGGRARSGRGARAGEGSRIGAGAAAGGAAVPPPLPRLAPRVRPIPRGGSEPGARSSGSISSGAMDSMDSSGCGSRKSPEVSASGSTGSAMASWIAGASGASGVGGNSPVSTGGCSSAGRGPRLRPRPPRRPRRRPLGRAAARRPEAGKFKLDCSSGTVLSPKNGDFACKCNGELRHFFTNNASAAVCVCR